MSKLNQIQNALKEMDGGAFQKLADSYIYKKGYKKINPIGSVVGADKVKKGTPDSCIRQDNGKLVFAEHTTDQTNIAKKLKGDLEKCFDANKTGIPLSEIEEIVFCHNSELSLTDEQSLYDLCKEKGIKIQIFGLQGISFELYQKYPSLAQDFLGISVDTGQILAPEEFVENAGKNQISTPLDTNFFYREEELKEVLEGVENGSLVILSGSAGVGKSRLALECLEEFKKSKTDYTLHVVHNKGPDLFEDLRSYFSQPGNFLLLVDDANRITQFDYIVDLIQNQRTDQNIKVIATVRDYALDKINKKAKALTGVSEIELKPMKAEEIKAFVAEQYDIKNSLYLDRISDIAGGNPRLAVMAAILAVKENNLESIRDVSALYDVYFSSISDDLKKLQDSNILKVAGIISFFRTLDKSHLETMELIQNVFGISPDDFWQCVEYLHEVEVVDVYEKEVVKISDQVFATYLFYLCFFKEKNLSFSVLLNNFFPSYAGKLRDALYPCLNSFNFEQISEEIRGTVKDRWNNALEEGNADFTHELIKSFWFLLQSDVLVYVRDCIDQMEEEPLDLANTNFESSNVTLNAHPLLEILALFRQASDETTFKTALDLVFKYVEKKPSSAPQFIKLMIDDFGFNRRSHHSEYLIQRILIEALWQKADGGKNKLFSRLFIEVGSKYLRTKFDSHEGSNRTITIYKFDLLAIEPIFSLRKLIWNGLFQLYQDEHFKEHVADTIKSYCGSGYYLSQKEIVEKDAENLIPFMEETFDSDDFLECLLIQKYNSLLTRREIDLAKGLSSKFSSNVYKLYKLLSFDYSDVEVDSISEFNEIKKEMLEKYIKNFDFGKWQTFISQSDQILSLLGDSHESYQIRNAISSAFKYLCEQDEVLCEKVVSEYLKAGNPLNLRQAPALIEKMLENCGANKTLSILTGAEYAFKKQWLFDYYRFLPPEDINSEAVNTLLSLYQGATHSELPHDYDYLLKYLEAESDFLKNIIKLLVEKAEKDGSFGYCLNMLFNHLTEINKNLFELLGDELDLIKKAYLIHCKSDKHADYNGATLRRILSIDPSFISDIIARIYSDDEWPDAYSDARDYSFLWDHENYIEILTIAIQDILKRELDRGYISGSYLESLFCVKSNKGTPPEIEEKQDAFLKSIIEEEASSTDLMRLIFKIVSELKPNRRKQFIKLFLDKNKNFKDFELLSFEPDSWGWSGSAVPMYQERVEFWESLLPLCDTVELLDHKLFIERNIQDYRARVEQEKKSDFIQDDG